MDYREDLTRVLTLEPPSLTPEQQRARMTVPYLLAVFLALDCIMLPAVLGVSAQTIPLLLAVIVPFGSFVAWFFWRERRAMTTPVTVRVGPDGVSVGTADRRGRRIPLHRIKAIQVGRMQHSDQPVAEVRTPVSLAYVGLGRSEQDLRWIVAWLGAAVAEAKRLEEGDRQTRAF